MEKIRKTANACLLLRGWVYYVTLTATREMEEGARLLGHLH